MLLIGTNEGVYRAPIDDIDDVTRVLDSEHVMRMRRFGGTIFAATRSGLFHSIDDGATWTDLGVPRREVYSVLSSPNGERLYAGTHPAHLYVSTDGGDSWHELEGLQDLPSREEWRLPRHRNEAHVRSLGAYPDAPERVVTGIEVGGVHVSDDDGVTWTERRVTGFDAPHIDDIHHVLVQDSDTYAASTGSGLYRTRDAGRSWTRLNPDPDRPYFQEAIAYQDRLYVATQTLPPGPRHPDRGVDAALFESHDGGDTFETVSYPDEPNEVVGAWTVTDGRVLAGMSGGQVIAREDDGWVTLGSVPVGVRSLAMS